MSENMLIIFSSHRFLTRHNSNTAAYFGFYFHRSKQNRHDDETVVWCDGAGNNGHYADADPVVNSLHVHAKTFPVALLRFRLR